MAARRSRECHAHLPLQCDVADIVAIAVISAVVAIVAAVKPDNIFSASSAVTCGTCSQLIPTSQADPTVFQIAEPSASHRRAGRHGRNADVAFSRAQKTDTIAPCKRLRSLYI